MRDLDPASTGRTWEPSGMQFICGGIGTSRGACDVKMLAELRPVRNIASQLLEETGAWRRAIRDIPPGHPIPPGVTAAIEAAYEATLAWMELLERKAKP